MISSTTVSPVVALALVLLATAPAAAQQVEIQKAPAPPVTLEREPGAASGIGDATRPSDGDVYPRGASVPHDPTFLGGLSGRRTTPTSTGRVGLAAWISPNTPVGSPNTGWRDVSGWLGLGFAVTWDGPPPRPAGRRAN